MMAVTTFQRARSEEQRAARRQAILDTAAAMLAEMPVAEVEPQRAEPAGRAWPSRTCCATSSPARRCCSSCWIRRWQRAGSTQLERANWPARSTPPPRPTERARARWRPRCSRARSPTGRCCATLISAQAAVLEQQRLRRRSPPQYKRAGTWRTSAALGRLVLRCVPELGDPDAAAGSPARPSWWRARCGRSTQPSAAMLAAYDADPAAGRPCGWTSPVPTVPADRCSPGASSRAAWRGAVALAAAIQVPAR